MRCSNWCIYVKIVYTKKGVWFFLCCAEHIVLYGQTFSPCINSVTNYTSYQCIIAHRGKIIFLCSAQFDVFSYASIVTRFSHIKILYDKVFLSNHNLTAHINTYSGEKTYQCNQCGKSYPRNNHLKEHLRTHRRDYHMYVVL